MTFNSLQYAAFFPVVLGLYWLLPRRPQNVLLLVASYVFYGAFDYRFLGLLVLSTLADYWFGLMLATDDSTKRRRWLVASLVVNLGILGMFKYFDFFADSARRMLEQFGVEQEPPLLGLVLPVGISFYTFHGISYVFDIYRGHIEPSRRLLDYAVFVAFFPQLVAGPIGRAQLQLPQFINERRRPSVETARGALLLILLGLFKKVAIADAVAPFVNRAFGASDTASGTTLLFGAWAFALQIYGDFSGYTDIARGSSRLLGIELPVNFRQPYLSRTITEFWRRWHVSLSTWLRDYLYIPLGGNRGTFARTCRNLMITMLLGGLWHGASWTFVVWGGIHGALLVVDRVLGRADADPERPIVWMRDLTSIIVTANLACAAFVVFRAASLGQAGDFLWGIVSLRGGAIDTSGVAVVIVAMLAMAVIDLSQRIADDDLSIRRWPGALEGAAVGCFLLGIAIFSGGTPVPFIYFQF